MPLSKIAVFRILDTKHRRERIYAARRAAVIRAQLVAMRGTFA